MTNPVYDADRAIAAALQSPALQHSQLLHTIGSLFNWWGGPGVIYFTALLWLGGRAMKHAPASLLGLRGAEAIAVASAAGSVVKGMAGRARPFVTPDAPWHWNFMHGWTDAHYFSMPSGHTYATVAFAVAIGVASVRWAPRARIIMSGAAFSTVLLVGFARLYTNQHWFSDVLAGVVIGTVTGVALTRWHERHPGTAFDRVMLGASAARGAA